MFWRCCKPMLSLLGKKRCGGQGLMPSLQCVPQLTFSQSSFIICLQLVCMHPPFSQSFSVMRNSTCSLSLSVHCRGCAWSTGGMPSLSTPSTTLRYTLMYVSREKTMSHADAISSAVAMGDQRRRSRSVCRIFSSCLSSSERRMQAYLRSKSC